MGLEEAAVMREKELSYSANNQRRQSPRLRAFWPLPSWYHRTITFITGVSHLILECYVIPVEYTSWGDAEAVVAMAFSAVGLLATLATCRVFLRHNDTPVVKASTRELSYLILAGITLAHVAVRGQPSKNFPFPFLFFL